MVLAFAEVIEEDLEGSNNGVVELQEVHDVSATQRSDDAVPRMTLNDCGLLNRNQDNSFGAQEVHPACDAGQLSKFHAR